MAWKIVRNGEPDFREIPYWGKCPRLKEDAKVTVSYYGTIQCRTDLQKTYTKKSVKCSLLSEANRGFTSCKDTCPLVPDKCL